MSDSEEENYCFFGKPLEPYDEDAFPKKKPISVEDQIATDAQGRRRFHGAFTGGFSAGFFNTVGSLEGWTPSEFKSTRQDKAQNRIQQPEDFMDDEDLGQFGIAPQIVRATSDYSTSKKRRRQVFSDGPIPGEPVLHSLLTSGNETIGYLLLKNIGLKENKKAQEFQPSSEERVYGCEMPNVYEISRDDEFSQYKIPDIYREYLQKPKDNTFGLGYEGLDKSHINLFQTSKLVIQEKDKKKVSISGQAFGVGAFEDEDEDIYVKEDMSRYDFELTSEKASKKDTLSKNQQTVFDDFIVSKNPLPPKEVFLPPTIPHSFTGKHKMRRSRFEPLPSKSKTPERKNMNPELRARYLGEEVDTPTENNTKISKNFTTSVDSIEQNQITPSKNSNKNEKDDQTPQNTDKKNLQLYSISSTGLVFDRFVSASKSEDQHNILEPVQPSETTHGTQEMRDAARMKMFGPLTRVTLDWQPCSLLCKRFNVPEPHCEMNTSKNKKRTKNLIFEYEKYSDISASDFKPGLSNKETNDATEETVEKGVDTVLDSIQETSQTSSDRNNSQENVVKTHQSEESRIIKESESVGNVQNAPKDITDKIDVDKNIDLFKAVFLSSSESEDETEMEKDRSDKTTEMKSSILSDSLLPKIKPIKEGILSNVDFSIFQKSPDVSKQLIEDKQTSSVPTDNQKQGNELSYGPVLPAHLTKNVISNSYKEYSVDDGDEWVEKSKKDKKNKSSHKKKNKKSSHKKRHKHSRN